MDPATFAMLGSAAGEAVGGITNLIRGIDDPGKSYLMQALELMQAVRDPQFDFRQLTPPQLQFIGQIDP